MGSMDNATNVTAVLGLSSPDGASSWIVSSPVPATWPAVLNKGESAFFTWTCQAAAGGTLQVTVTASGDHVLPVTVPLTPITPAVASGQMPIYDAELTATLFIPSTAARGRPVIFSVRVGNFSMVSASNVVPLGRTWSGCGVPSELRFDYVTGGTLISVSGPYPACPISLNPGQETVFTWTATAADQGAMDISVDLTASGTGVPMSVVHASATDRLTVKDLCAQLFLNPERVSLGQNVAVIGRITACGPETEPNVVPLSYTAVGCGLPADISVSPPAGGNVFLLSGPTPGCSVTLLSGASAYFTWMLTTTKTGRVDVTVTFTGLGVGEPYPKAAATAELEIQAPAQLSVTLWSEPAETVPFQQNVAVYLGITNLGEATADSVSPLPQSFTGTGALTLLPCPSGIACPETGGESVISIMGGTTQVFTWVYRVDQPGYVVISSAAAGIDFNTAQPIQSGAALLPLLLPNPSVLSVTLTGAAKLVQGQEFAVRADLINPTDLRVCQAELSAGGFRALLNGSPEHVTIISVDPLIPRCYEVCADCAIGGELNCCRREFTITLRLSESVPLGSALLSLSLAGNDSEGVGIIGVGYPMPVEISSGMPGIRAIEPNPFRLSRGVEARITFVVSPEQSGKPVALGIYTVTGELVATLVEGAFGPGIHEAVWDGRNQGGKTVASGVYILLLQAQPGRDVAKLGVIK